MEPSEPWTQGILKTEHLETNGLTRAHKELEANLKLKEEKVEAIQAISVSFRLATSCQLELTVEIVDRRLAQP